MTPEERADAGLKTLDGCLACTPPDMAREMIAGLIREAVAAERVRWARVLTEFDAQDDDGNFVHPGFGYWVERGGEAHYVPDIDAIVARIREG